MRKASSKYCSFQKMFCRSTHASADSSREKNVVKVNQHSLFRLGSTENIR